MNEKIIEILKEELYASSGFGSDEVFGIEKAASRIEGLGEDKMSAEEWLKNKLDDQEYTYDLRDSNRKAFPLKIWIEWMEQYAKYRTT